MNIFDFLALFGPYSLVFGLCGPVYYLIMRYNSHYDLLPPFGKWLLKCLGIYIPIGIILFKAALFISMVPFANQNAGSLQPNDNIKSDPVEFVLQGNIEKGATLTIGRYYYGGPQKFQREYQDIKKDVMKEYCDAYGNKRYRNTIYFMDIKSREILGKVDIDTAECQGNYNQPSQNVKYEEEQAKPQPIQYSSNRSSSGNYSRHGNRSYNETRQIHPQ